MGSFLTGATGTGNSFAAQAAPIQGQDFTGNLANSRGAVNDVMSGENSLASTLTQQMNGFGPNPEALQTQQMNENAIKSNTGMIASQKGISPAIAARLAAQNAAGMQQQAAGQGAAMGMNRQLATQGALQSLYGQQGNQALGLNTNDQNAIGSFNNAQVGNTSNMNNNNQATSAQNANTSKGLLGGLVGGLTGGLFARGGVVGEPQPLAMGGPAQPMAPSMAQNYMTGNSMGMGQGLGSALRSGLMSLFGSKQLPADGPGSQEDMDSGGLLTMGAQEQEGNESGLGPQLFAGNPAQVTPMGGGAVQAGSGSYGAVEGDPFAGVGPNYQVGQKNPDFFADGGPVPDHLQHMATIYHPDFGNLKAAGGPVPGKAPVSTTKNNYANDVVDTKLTPGEVVIDLETLHDKGKIGEAARMVAAAIQKRNQNGTGNHSADFHDALKKSMATRKAR